MTAQPAPNTPEWLELRRKYLGASDAAIALGLADEWKSRGELWKDKTGRDVKAPSAASLKNFHRGHALETPIAMAFSKMQGILVGPAEHCVHPEHEWMACTPDCRVQNGTSLVQIKTADSWGKGHWGPSFTTEYPMPYFVQCAHEMAVTGADLNYLCVLIADTDALDLLTKMVDDGVALNTVAEYITQLDMRIYPIERNIEWEKEVLIPGLKEFWENHVVADVEPVELAKMQDSGEYIEDDEKADEIAEALKVSWMDVELAKARYEDLKGDAQFYIGEMSGIMSSSGKISWTKGKDKKKTDWESLCEEVFNLYPNTQKLQDKFTTTTEASRTFRVPHAQWKKKLKEDGHAT